MEKVQDRISGVKFGWLIFEGDKTMKKILKVLRYFLNGDSRSWIKNGRKRIK